MSETFVYMWYVASTGMYYIGYSGQNLDEYTHSSRDEEFCKLVPSSKSSIVERRDFLKNIPKGVRRRVLARGTKEEMIELEHELLENRKAKCWYRYYNLATCFPPPPMFGEDHHCYKHGLSQTPEYKRVHAKKSREKNPDYNKKWHEKNPDYNREYVKNWRKENPERDAENTKQYQTKNRERILEYTKIYYAQNSNKLKKQDRKRKRKKKLEKQQAQANLDNFFA